MDPLPPGSFSTPGMLRFGRGRRDLVFLRKILENEGDSKAEAKSVLKLSDSDNLFERLVEDEFGVKGGELSFPAPSRADIFPAGFTCLSKAMSYFNQNEIIHSYRNLRHGIAMGLAMEG